MTEKRIKLTGKSCGFSNCRAKPVSGNPVVRIRAAAAEFDLVVLGLRGEHNSPLAPDVSTFLLHDLPITALFVPWSPAG